MIAQHFRQLNVYRFHLYFMKTGHELNCCLFISRECTLTNIFCYSDIFGEEISSDEEDEKDVNIVDSEEDISRQQSYVNLESLTTESQEGLNETDPSKLLCCLSLTLGIS